MPRSVACAVAIGLTLAACGSSDRTGGERAVTPSGGSARASSSEPRAVPQVPSSPRAVTSSGLQAAVSGIVPLDLPEPAVDVGELRSGGPPPDGIPSIDEPVVAPAHTIGFLEDREPVLAFELDGEARAYPVQIMTWHEIVNDTVAGVPVAVTYCPLCNSAVAYDRRVGDRVLDFGTSGLLWNSALVMYDRQTETLWSHFTGEGVLGELTGVELDVFPLSTVSWSDWREAHPDGLVLTRDTGYDRDYGRNPYPGYDDLESAPFLFEGDVDGRYTAMTRVVGIESGGHAVAVPLHALREVGVVETELGDIGQVTVWWTAGTASALDSTTIDRGRDVGTTGVFVPTADGTSLTFAPSPAVGGFVDAQTGSTWDVLGRAVAGPLAGSRLEAVPHVDTFWFAWSTFLPDTVVVGGP